jgi:hypothetical protein
VLSRENDLVKTVRACSHLSLSLAPSRMCARSHTHMHACDPPTVCATAILARRLVCHSASLLSLAMLANKITG